MVEVRKRTSYTDRVAAVVINDTAPTWADRCCHVVQELLFLQLDSMSCAYKVTRREKGVLLRSISGNITPSQQEKRLNRPTERRHCKKRPFRVWGGHETSTSINITESRTISLSRFKLECFDDTCNTFETISADPILVTMGIRYEVLTQTVLAGLLAPEILRGGRKEGGGSRTNKARTTRECGLHICVVYCLHGLGLGQGSISFSTYQVQSTNIAGLALGSGTLCFPLWVVDGVAEGNSPVGGKPQAGIVEGLSVPGETDARLVTSPNSIMTVNSLGLRVLLIACCVSVATTRAPNIGHKSSDRIRENYMGIGFKALDRPSFCVTPTEEQGVCVSLNSCSDLLDLLRARPIRPEVAQFLRDSQCGFEGNYPKMQIRLVAKIKRKKAPGSDGIRVEVLQHASDQIAPFLTNLMNECMSWGLVPSVWKKSEVVILSKGEDKDPQLPKSYRPIYLLNVIGKLREKILCNRLKRHREVVGLHQQRYGFRRGRSTEAMRLGSVYWPVFWDVALEPGLVEIETLPETAGVVTFVDDILIIVGVATIRELETKSNAVLTGKKNTADISECNGKYGIENLKPSPGLVQFITVHGPYRSVFFRRCLTDKGSRNCGREATPEHVVLACAESLETTTVYHILWDVYRWSLLDAIADDVSKHEGDV
uniref:Clip domain-containing protein n=1 Tax=Timema poppense TaxID=170557 RepID=A0A7R9CKA2_TIMPO|nr:unnamed protein product [Timema poppensis]